MNHHETYQDAIDELWACSAASGVDGFQIDMEAYATAAKQLEFASGDRCSLPPHGWWCSRESDHDGPCAARPATHHLTQRTEKAIDEILAWDRQDRTLTCECPSLGHVIRLSTWEPGQICIEFLLEPRGFWTRVKAAFAVLVGKRAALQDVVVDEGKIREWLR